MARVKVFEQNEDVPKRLVAERFYVPNDRYKGPVETRV